MKAVRYARPRPNFRRTLRPRDLDMLGLENKGETLVWSPENKFTIVMSNKASESLVAKLPGEFILFDAEGDDEPEEVLDPMTSLASTQSSSPEEQPDESQPDPDTASRASTRSKSKDA